MSGTFLSFDFGTKSIGVAVGQRITGTARPLPALKAQDGKPDFVDLPGRKEESDTSCSG